MSDRMNVGAAGNFERRLYIGSAAVATAVVLVGFSKSFYLRAWFDGPPLSTLRYLHGALMTLWYGLFMTQVVLVSRRRIDLHRRLGIFAALVAIALIPTGVATAIAMVSRLRSAPDDAALAATIAGFDFVSLLVFAVLVGTALVLRRRSDIHKRLMTLASMSLLGPPLARLVSDELAVWLTYALVLLPIAIDSYRHRRLHPAFGWGGMLILVTSQAAFHYVTSPGWVGFVLRTLP